MVQGVPGRLRPRIFLTFRTTRMVGRQPYAPAAFTTGTHFQGLSRLQGTWFRRGEPRKKFPVTPPGIDPGISQLVAQCLNHYATPGPCEAKYVGLFMKYLHTKLTILTEVIISYCYKTRAEMFYFVPTIHKILQTISTSELLHTQFQDSR